MAIGSAEEISAPCAVAPNITRKGQFVKQVFEDAPRYLKSRRVDILFRMETVRAMAARVSWSRLLDVGCGDGTISMQLLTSSSRLTLLDLSGEMVARVKSNIPSSLEANVEVRNEDFIAASLGAHSFDLVVTVGVLAHVDSPDEFIAKIKHVLRPGGSLILEFTDCQHFVGRLGRLWGRLKELVAPPKYTTNRLCYADLELLFEKHALRPICTFRYARIPIPGFDRIISAGLQYRLIKGIFGNSFHNTNSWLGNEYLFLLASDSAQ